MDTVGYSAEAALKLYWGSLVSADEASDGLTGDEELPEPLDEETRAFADKLAVTIQIDAGHIVVAFDVVLVVQVLQMFSYINQRIHTHLEM